MNYIERVEHWGDMHHPKWIDIVRIILGAFLVYKGIDFLMHTGTVMAMVLHHTSYGASFKGFQAEMIGQYVSFAHILGGLLLMLGIGTRVASLIQIPILIGALFFLHSSDGIFMPYGQFILTAVVLALLVYFMIAGNGKWSLKVQNEDDGKPEHGL